MFWNLHILQALQGSPVKTVIKTMNMFATGEPKTKSQLRSHSQQNNCKI